MVAQKLHQWAWSRRLGGCLVAACWIIFGGGDIAVSAPGASQPVAKPLLRIEAGFHTAGVLRVSTDAQDRYAVTVALDKTIRVWELPGLKLQRILRPPIGPGSEGTLYAVAMSPDGRTIATGGVSGSIYLFERESGKVIRRVSGVLGQIFHLTFSPNGQWLVATLWGSQGIRVLETKGYRVVAEDRDYGGASHYAEFDSMGRLATVSDDGHVRLYALTKEGGTSLKRLVKSVALGAQPRSVSFAPDGQRLAVGFGDRPRVDILQIQNLSVLDTLDTARLEPRQVLLTVAWDRDGRTLYAAGDYTKMGHARGEAFIRKWMLDKNLAAEDIPAGNESIEQLLPLKNGGILFATHDPGLGLLDATGTRQQFLASPIPDFRGMGNAFQVSDQGTVVQFAYDRGESFGVFSLERHNKLVTRSETEDDLKPPETGGGGLGIFGGLFGQGDMPSVDNWHDTPSPTLNGQSLKLDTGEISRSVAVAPDRNGVLLGTESRLRLYDRSGHPRWQVAVPGPAWSVNIAANGKIAVAAIGDGTIRWYRLSDGRELLALFPHRDRKRWVLWTPKGYFDASSGSEELIGWHINQSVAQEALFLPAGRFYEEFYHPPIVADTLKNVATDEEILLQRHEPVKVDMQVGVKPPPRVTILSPAADGPIDGDELDVLVQAEDQGGGVDEIQLFHNDKVIGIGTRGVKVVKDSTRSFHIRLLEGSNKLRAVAYSRERVEGPPAEREVIRNATSPVIARPTLHLVLVGINEYQNPGYNLFYSVPDAKGVEKFFGAAKSQQTVFTEIKRYLLYDDAATKAAILGTLKRLSKIPPGDVVLIYLAGHGKTISGQWYFVPYELINAEDNNAVQSKAVSSTELKDGIAGIGGKKILVLMDSCYSGAALVAFLGRGGPEERKALMHLARATGTHIVAATTSAQVANEVGDLGHGVFTYTLLEALKGDADGSPRDGIVTVREVTGYLDSRITEISEKYKTEAQYPVMDSRGQDFPLALVQRK